MAPAQQQQQVAPQPIQTDDRSGEVDISAAQEAIESLPEGERLTLEEMSRIMDVAVALRKERALVEHQLNIDEVKVELRRRLMEAARVSGDPVTEAEIDAAVDHYYDRMHVFEEPPLSVEKILANLYVRRTAIVTWLVGLAAGVGVYLAFFS